MSITTLPRPSAKSEPTQEQYWKKHVARQKYSGLSKAAYCRQHQLNYNRFYYWSRKEKQPTPRLIPIEIKSVEAISESVSVTAPMPPVLCTLTLRAGRVLAIHDKGSLHSILRALS